jgi:hypothetical protein
MEGRGERGAAGGNNPEYNRSLAMKKKPAGIALWLVWIVTVVLAVIPIGYFLSHICDKAFVPSTMGNWFATVIGVVVGIPIALGLSRWQEKEQERREQSTREEEASTRKAEILRLIQTELKHNYDQIEGSTIRAENGSKTNNREVFIEGLKDELWNAFSDGGEVRWIRDLQLLHNISVAYYYIRRIMHLENQYLTL